MDRHGDGSGSPPPVDARIAVLAASQHGVVALWQLLAAGLGRDAVDYRTRVGRLHRVFPAVYAVGHARLGPSGRLMAAVLACGHDAVLSHRSAAVHWGLLSGYGARVDVSLPRRRRPGAAIRPHRSRTLTPEDVTRHDGIPVTTVARTLLDFACVATPRQVERAVHEAEVLRRFDLRAVERVLARAAGRHGATVLRTAVAAYGTGPAVTRSELEEAFLVLVRDAGLPRPQLNVRVAGLEVDAYWPDHRLAVELDGAAYHHTRRAYEEDRRRDVRLLKAKVRVARFTAMRLRAEPQAVIGDLRQLTVDSGRTRSS